jgi:hypothetical protein
MMDDFLFKLSLGQDPGVLAVQVFVRGTFFSPYGDDNHSMLNLFFCAVGRKEGSKISNVTIDLFRLCIGKDLNARIRKNLLHCFSKKALYVIAFQGIVDVSQISP